MNTRATTTATTTRSEDVQDEIDCLKHKIDLDEYVKPKSVVMGEKYNRKYPVVTVYDLSVSDMICFCCVGVAIGRLVGR